MNFNSFVGITAVLFISLVDSKDDSAVKILSRRKRYVSFPEGSSFSCAACVTLGVVGQPARVTTPGVFTFGLNWGLAYELPNDTMTLDAIYQLSGKKKVQLQRRNRRDLYGKVETIMNSMGYSGRACVLKTLCETTQRIAPRGANLIEEIFRTIFTLPLTKRIFTEDTEVAIYEQAHRMGLMLENCDEQYRECPLSLVDLVKGYYNAKSGQKDWSNNPMSLFVPGLSS